MSNDPDVPKKPVGRLERAVSRIFTRTATLEWATALADGFRLLALSGEALRNVSWTPGQKVQVMLGGWTQRTYTPLSWDAESGKTSLLAYLHGTSPACVFARTLAVGDSCALFGPRASLDLNALERPALLFGDETSFGLAHALRHTPGGAAGVHLLLEVTEPESARAALDAIGVNGAQLVARRSDDAHLDEIEKMATTLIESERLRGCVLSGKATSIARLVKRLRQLEVPRRQIQSKAYWAPGKVGLD